MTERPVNPVGSTADNFATGPSQKTPLAAPFDVEQSIACRFEKQVAQHGDRLALKTSRTQLTYAELNALANRQAHALLARNMTLNEPVALLLDHGAAYITALLGLLKIGACFVPLDRANPPARIAQMLQDAGAKCLVTQGAHLALAKSAAGDSCEVLDLDSPWPGTSDQNPEISVSPDALAYVLYTSGSTGRPKGVMQDQRSVLHNAMRHASAFQITPDDRQTLLYTCSVYGGIRDTLNALLNGASLHTFHVKHQGVERLGQWLKDSRITIYCSVTTVFRQFAATLREENSGFPDLRLIKLGGEASNRKDVDLYRKHFSRGCVLHCGLGSTETGVARHFFVDHHTKLEGAGVPLGYAIDDVDVRLETEDGAPAAPGKVGEIVIRSRYIARGYWRRPDLNSSVFSSDEADPLARIFRTGDLGVLRADGCLEHRGRKDLQVKVRGNRIELAEIEMALRDIDGIAHAAVTARSDRRAETYLVAYIVPRGPKPGVGALRRALAATLPDFMIPSVFMMLDEMPQTPNGKIDRQALPAPDAGRPQLEQTFAAPRTALEASLAILWGELLGIDRVGADDDYFELGGDSLIAVRLMARVREHHGKILPLAVLFEACTVTRFAAALEHDAEPAPWSPLVPIQPRGSRTPFFCIHPGGGNVLGYQEFVSHLDTEQPVYGVQAHGVVEGQQPHDDIPTMARLYLGYIRKVQPHGPYRLGGTSFGGLVAYEMACQLAAVGERVEFLFLGDVWTRNVPHFNRLRYLGSCLTYVFTVPWAEWKKQFARKLLRRDEPLVFFKRYTYADALHRRNSLAHRAAARRYAPGRFEGRLTLFRALSYKQGDRRLEHYFGGPHMNWAALASEVDVHWTNGGHLQMLHGQNSKGFARALQACLDRS
ncbi:MAG: AMP-binding protein [Gammaproteobacteria bacterium]